MRKAIIDLLYVVGALVVIAVISYFCGPDMGSITIGIHDVASGQPAERQP